ncbi:MAG: glycine cleavage T C-terminal barrel domain-containing protein, partial [Actinomycetota bacterium]
ILGEAPEIKNFFVAAGFNSVGIASAGGAGRALAEWIVAGEPQGDLVSVDIRRFGAFNNNPQWLRSRVGEVLGLHYAVPWPNREFDSARPFRRSPLHARMEESGAAFGSKFGWERPVFFAPDGAPPVIDYSWGQPTWIPWVDAEQRATREAVALFDESSFGKLLITGPDAQRLLARVCANDIAVPPGRIVYTAVLNSRGTYEADVTVTRLAHDEYLWITGAASPVRDADWLRRHVEPGMSVSVVDVSSAYAVIGVMGSLSRELMTRVSTSDFSAEAFPFAASRLVDVGDFTARASRITYVGELGWELVVPAEFAVGVYDALKAAGAELGVRDAGYYAINALRLEKGYRAFGPELNPDYGPVEAGLLFAAKSASDFIGRGALRAAQQAPPRRRLVSWTAEDPSAMLWGGELMIRDGVGVGQVTSAAYATTTGACVGLGYVRGDADLTGSWAISVGGRMVPVSV